MKIKYHLNHDMRLCVDLEDAMEWKFRWEETNVMWISKQPFQIEINPLKPELNPICYFLALLAHHLLHVSRIRVKTDK